jgi:hypothetical protein
MDEYGQDTVTIIGDTMSNTIIGRRTSTIEVDHNDGIKILKRIKRNHKLYPNLVIDVDTTLKPYRVKMVKTTKVIQKIKITISYDIKMRNK